MGSYVRFLECGIINKKLRTNYTPDELDKSFTIEERALIIQMAIAETERLPV